MIEESCDVRDYEPFVIYIIVFIILAMFFTIILKKDLQFNGDIIILFILFVFCAYGATNLGWLVIYFFLLIPLLFTLLNLTFLLP